MSLYAKYLTEKTDDKIMETDKGFVTYRYLDDKKTVYITDIYILPDFRKTNEASLLADRVCDEARENKCSIVMGTVVPSNKNSTDSLRVLLGYGMRLFYSSNDLIAFRKDI